ncbi:uncharacterized protein LOC142796305 isoform X3 [Rhipicephalus microplus]|uniref:uncharacterized protein LOC142796305 isoform X3 n=1 Tax=Rhipicephalus microplus TaxID=6941 RepID=UPI003F6CAE77
MTTTWEKGTVDTSVGIIRVPTLRGSAGMLVIAVTVETLRSLMWRSLTLQFRGKHCHMLGGASIEPVTLGLVKPCFSWKVSLPTFRQLFWLHSRGKRWFSSSTYS